MTLKCVRRARRTNVGTASRMKYITCTVMQLQQTLQVCLGLFPLAVLPSPGPPSYGALYSSQVCTYARWLHNALCWLASRASTIILTVTVDLRPSPSVCVLIALLAQTLVSSLGVLHPHAHLTFGS